jgi:hypothetical protein
VMLGGPGGVLLEYPRVVPTRPLAAASSNTHTNNNRMAFEPRRIVSPIEL